MSTTRTRPARTRRINLRATPHQDRLLRAGAQVKAVSVTDFIIESACLHAEHALADKREFVLSASEWRKFSAALDKPARSKPALARLFADVARSNSKSKK